MQSRDDFVSIESAALNSGNSDDSRMWYVRLRIRDDRLAKLWAWKLAEHDVIVWSDAEERWEQLLAVPELRAAVRKATASAYARQKTASEFPEAAASRGEQKSLCDLDNETSTLHIQRNLGSVTLLEDVDEPTSVRQRWSSAPAPKTLDPILHALTTSIPPAVHTNPPPDIPKAPRLPRFGDNAANSEHEAVGRRLEHRVSIAGGFLRRQLRAVVNAVSQVPAKSASWAMLPVVGAAVFVIMVFNGPEPQPAFLPASRSEDNALAEWGIEDQQIAERLAAKLTGAAPICAGQMPQPEPPRILSPEQLALVTNETTKAAAPAGRSYRMTASTSAVRRKPLASGKASPVTLGAETERNNFDRDAARTALRFAMARARNCSNSGITGSVLITFAPGGTVQNAQISQLVGDDVDPSCVSRAFSASRVPPFNGNAVTVRKSF